MSSVGLGLYRNCFIIFENIIINTSVPITAYVILINISFFKIPYIHHNIEAVNNTRYMNIGNSTSSFCCIFVAEYITSKNPTILSTNAVTPLITVASDINYVVKF